jgi:hypothetical protein
MWTQIVGKTRMALDPLINHWWNVTLYVTPLGLSTFSIPYANGAFELAFDFVSHRLTLRTSYGRELGMPLYARSVADFYSEYMSLLRSAGIEVKIDRKPAEFDDVTPFDEDAHHASYDKVYVERFRSILIHADRLFKKFRTSFMGKSSPVHFFWGAFDLAVTRFSGRIAPPHPGGIPNLPDRVTRDAYSHEVSSAGFWPGGAVAPYPLFYSYAYPEPRGFAESRAQPPAARYDATLHEFVLPYADVRRSAEPAETLLAFLQSTYEAAAELGAWDRRSLEVPAETLREKPV